ncbi:unnamed protein product [Blepharisma stoltei]|uniref:ABC transporter permease n=1 Tax=Blepharisma stoltei TaxID=1481888 RepID=A0AAU9KEH0_9CILI|nr:unnamed protein product [Blepharisma stoltei]
MILFVKPVPALIQEIARLVLIMRLVERQLLAIAIPIIYLAGLLVYGLALLDVLDAQGLNIISAYHAIAAITI